MAEKGSGHKVQAVIPEYIKFVLEGLVDIEGKSISDVINHILTTHIRTNAEYYNVIHLGVDDWKESRKENQSK